MTTTKSDLETLLRRTSERLRFHARRQKAKAEFPSGQTSNSDRLLLASTDDDIASEIETFLASLGESHTAIEQLKAIGGKTASEIAAGLTIDGFHYRSDAAIPQEFRDGLEKIVRENEEGEEKSS